MTPKAVWFCRWVFFIAQTGGMVSRAFVASVQRCSVSHRRRALTTTRASFMGQKRLEAWAMPCAMRGHQHAKHTVMMSAKAISLEHEVDNRVLAGLEIVKYPHPALRAPNEEMKDTDLETAGQLARRMFDLMYESQGVGLAAPQVGINKRLMVFNPEGKKERWLDEIVLVNPRIVDRSQSSDTEVEGCLSFPGMSGHVERNKWVKIEAISPKGKKIKKKYTGWVARIFQHEYDHLDGVVYIDRLSPNERGEVQPTLDKLVEVYDKATHGPAAL